MKAMIIVNPSSGSEKAKEYMELLKSRLKEKFEDVVIYETKKAGDAMKFASKAAVGKLDAIFLIGGDGTVNEGVNGVAVEDYQPNIGIIPTGTINNVARTLGISMEPEEAINQLNFDHQKKIDIGKANDVYFVSTVSAGAIPETVQDVDEDSKSKLGPLAYVFEGLKSLNDDSTSTFQMTIDDKYFEEDYSLLLIGLSQSVAGIETVFPSAEIDDGYLYMLCLKEATAIEKIKLIPELLSTSQEYSDKLVFKRFKTADIKIKEENNFTTTVDGGSGPVFPIHLEVLHKFLSIYVPTE